MKTVSFARYDLDSGYVYGRLSDGNIILINCTAYKQAHADNMYERSELDYLIFNDPAGYVELVLDDNPEAYLKAVAKHRTIES